MKLAKKLIGYLGSAFDKDPGQTVGLRFTYDGNMNWSVDNNVLTTIVSGGTGGPLTITLSDYTLSALSSYISSQQGYVVTYNNSDISNLSAIVIMDGSGIQGLPSNDVLYAHRSLLWAWFDGVAQELFAVAAAIKDFAKELIVGTASSDWLNVHGDLYGIIKIEGETDSQYATRIISETVELKATNLALEQAIEDQTGVQVTVADIDWWYNSVLVTDLGFTNLAPGSPPTGGYPYWGLDANNNPVVCTFAVILGVVNVNSLDAVTVATIKNIVNKYRASGTYGRYFAPAGSFLNTNTAAENTNDAVFLSGPGLPVYSEVTI